MSDAVLISLITTIPGFVTVVGVVYVQIRSVQKSVTAINARHDILQGQNTELSENQKAQAIKVNGKLDELLKATKEVAYEAGLTRGTLLAQKADENEVGKFETLQQLDEWKRQRGIIK